MRIVSHGQHMHALKIRGQTVFLIHVHVYTRHYSGTLHALIGQTAICLELVTLLLLLQMINLVQEQGSSLNAVPTCALPFSDTASELCSYWEMLMISEAAHSDLLILLMEL